MFLLNLPQSLLALMKQQPVWVLPSVTQKMECKYQRFNALRFCLFQTLLSDSLIFFCRASVAHLDSPKVVDMGLSQMMSLLVQDNMDVELDVLF